MKNMGYDVASGEGLLFGKGRRAPLLPFAPRGKHNNYYHQSRRGLGYASPPQARCLESYKDTEDDYSTDESAESLLWDSDVSTGTVFKGLIANMTIADSLENGEDDQMSSYPDHWSHHLDSQWDGRFEQREPPTEDKVLQVNMGDEINPKPIFISDSLSPQEKEDLILLVREYIDVFAWNYEDMPGLNP